MNSHALRSLGTSLAGTEHSFLSVRSRYSAVLGANTESFVMVQVSQKETAPVMLNFIHRRSTKTENAHSKCQRNFSHNSSWLVLAFFGAILSLLSLSTLTEIESHITSSAKINAISLPHTRSWWTLSKAKPLPNASAINFKTFNRSVKWSMQAVLHLCS